MHRRRWDNHIFERRVKKGMMHAIRTSYDGVRTRAAGARGRPRRVVATVAILGLTLGLAACGGSSSNSGGGATNSTSSAKSPLKVGVILFGMLHDIGWDSAFYQAIQATEQKYGNKVSISYKLDVPESPQVTQVMNSMIQSGDKLIIGTSFGYGQYMQRVAAQNADVKFECYECSTMLPNMASFDSDFPAGFYLSGMVAGAASKNGDLGITGGFPVPNNIEAINQFELGARQMNPRAVTHVVYINSWYDPSAGRQAAQGLLSSGADVLGTMLNSPETGQAAQSAGGLFIGRDFAGQEAYAPKAWLTGAVENWSIYFEREVGAMLAGSWKTHSVLLNFPNCCKMAPFGPAYYQHVTTGERSKIASAMQKVETGSFDAFTGPIADNKGRQRVAAGQSLSPAQRSTMTWYVKGVVVSS